MEPTGTKAQWHALVAARVSRLAAEKGATAAQTAKLVEIVDSVAEAIEALGTVPSGHLYAHLMGMLGLTEYQGIINILKALDLVRESNHVLTWTGHHA